MSEELKNLPRALYTGSEPFNKIKLVAAILNDEDRTHVFSERSLANAFGFKGGGAYWKRKKLDSAELPEYLSSPILNEFVNSDLRKTLESAISYISISKQIATGLEATVLPLICDVFVKASKAHPTNENLKKAADVAYQIILAFSQYGVLRWVEKITGYKYEDEERIIYQQLAEYVSPQILDWQKEFHSDFYLHIYRLKGWPYNPNTVNRPGVVGTYTNMYIYSCLPKTVFEFIKTKTPKSKAGNYLVRLHQSLNLEKGKEVLRNQLVSVTTLLKISKSWEDFKNKFMQLYGQTQLDFEEPTMELKIVKEDDKTNNHTAPNFGQLLGAVARAGKPEK